MSRLVFAAAICACMVAGCAATPRPGAGSLPWLDEAFEYQPSLVTVQADDLFRLDPELERKLAASGVRQASTSQRLKHLLATIFGSDGRGFGYVAGHSTTATETWRNKRGDCLSLTVLTYSVARALGMPAQMQEVQAPAIFDRRGQLDVVNQHVNVLFARAHRDLTEASAGRDVVVDFEPDFANGRRGAPLSEMGILARYYNNVAVESMTLRRHDLAYAYFRAAMRADPAYAAPYANIAVLYRRIGRELEAEQWLRHAVALGGPSDVALHELHQLLVNQGRGDEASEYATQLESRRAADPYYWIGLGIRRLQDGEPRAAISALERARELTAGFEEVHRYLAIAYARAGELHRANEELLVLASLGAAEGDLLALRKKIDRLRQQPVKGSTPAGS